MPTPFAACPTEVVGARIEIVWGLLTDFAGWGNFYDIRVVRVEPPGPGIVGQKMFGKTGAGGLRLPVVFEFKLIDESQRKLEISGQLPLGLYVLEALDCVPLTPETCRVNYHCNFTIPDGFKGLLFRTLLKRGFTTGPEDSLHRLKRAAEQANERQSGDAKMGDSGGPPKLAP